MADAVVTHAFVSAVPADGPDATAIQPLRDWNDTHAFSGGAEGEVLVRRAAAARGAAWEALAAGPDGPAGPTGPTGATGPAGASGGTTLPALQRWWGLMPLPGGSATGSGFGIPAVAQIGTVAAGDVGGTPWAKFTTPATINQHAGIGAGATAQLFTSLCDPVLRARLKTGASVSGLRYWIGLQNAYQNAADQLAGHYAAFRFLAPSPNDGTVAVDVDGNVTGTSSFFLSACIVGDYFKAAGQSAWSKIATRTSNTALTLTDEDGSAYTNGAVTAGATYDIRRDRGWVGATCDGTAINQQLTPMVADIAPNTEYLLQVRLHTNGTVAAFSVNGGTELTLALNLPATTVLLGPYGHLAPVGANAAKEWYVGGVDVVAGAY